MMICTRSNLRSLRHCEQIVAMKTPMLLLKNHPSAQYTLDYFQLDRESKPLATFVPALTWVQNKSRPIPNDTKTMVVVAALNRLMPASRSAIRQNQWNSLVKLLDTKRPHNTVPLSQITKAISYVFFPGNFRL